MEAVRVKLGDKVGVGDSLGAQVENKAGPECSGSREVLGGWVAGAEAEEGEGVSWETELELGRVRAAGAFLDGCRVLLTGFNREQEIQLTRVLKHAGASRLTQLVESVRRAGEISTVVSLLLALVW